MNCPKCKRSVPDESVFCLYCGKKLIVQKKKIVKSRGNGQGTAIRRGKTWTAVATLDWILPDDPSKPKRPIRKTKGGFATKADALAYCPVLKAGGYLKKTEAPRLAEYWDVYSEGRMQKLSNNKQSAYKTAWKKLKPIHDVRVDAITVELLQTSVSAKCKTFDTAKDCKSLLSNLFELAAADQFASRDLPSFISLPEKNAKERIPFSLDEQKKIWKAYDNGDMRAAIPLLMIYTGMMPGEAMRLRVVNIDLVNRTITGVGMKTKVRKETPLLISDSILPVVEDLIDHAQPSGYIWKRNEKEWYDAYYTLLSDIGCRRLTPYSCRHTTATALAVNNNIAPQTIKKIMRWSTSRMLDTYSHPSISDALEGVNKLTK